MKRRLENLWACGVGTLAVCMMLLYLFNWWNMFWPIPGPFDDWTWMYH